MQSLSRYSARTVVAALLSAALLVAAGAFSGCAARSAHPASSPPHPLPYRMAQALEGDASPSSPSPPDAVAHALTLEARSVMPAVETIVAWLHAQGHDTLRVYTYAYVSSQRYAIVTSRERRVGKRPLWHVWAIVRAPASSDLERDVLHGMLQRARALDPRGDDLRMHRVGADEDGRDASLFASTPAARWAWLWLLADGRQTLSSTTAKWPHELAAHAARVETIVGARGFSLRGDSSSQRFDALLHVVSDSRDGEGASGGPRWEDRATAVEQTLVLSLGAWLMEAVRKDCPHWALVDGSAGLSILPVLTDARGTIIRPFSFVRAKIRGEDVRRTEVYRAHVRAQCPSGVRQ